MAKIIIENATVVRTFASGSGAALKERKKIEFGKLKGETIDLYYTVWAPFEESFDFSEEDVVSVEGEPSADLNTWSDKETGDEKHRAELVVRNTVVLAGSHLDEDDDEGFA